MDLEIPESEKVIAAVDSTGIKVRMGSGCADIIGEKRWNKVHIAIDVENKELLSIEVIDRKGGSKVFENLVEI